MSARICPEIWSSGAPHVTQPKKGSIAPAMASTKDIDRWINVLHEDLWSRILPFWMQHSIDPLHGGFFNNLGRCGGVYSTQKHVWLQGRQAWMFAKIANLYTDAEIEAFTRKYPSHVSPSSKGIVETKPLPVTRANLVEQSQRCVDFLIEHALQKEEPHHVYFCLARDGTPSSVQRKPFSATFMIMALNEVGKATGEAEYRKLALEMLDRCIVWMKTGLGKPELPGMPVLFGLAQPMILLNVIMELMPDSGQDGFYPNDRKWCIEEILKHVVKKETYLLKENIMVENVQPEGELDLSLPDGRLCNPGHAIECGWFLIDYARLIKDTALEKKAQDIIKANFEFGWDKEDASGGILYFFDAMGYSPTQLEWFMKLWWPACESMIAHAKSFESTLAAEDWERFERVAAWAYKHLVDKEYSEWFGYADRTSTVTHLFKGGPYKGCFHVPRAVLFSLRALEKARENMK
jgi:N-acylglucosamine 2-epimerase